MGIAIFAFGVVVGFVAGVATVIVVAANSAD